MAYSINKEALKKVIEGNKAERLYLCEKDFSLFFTYYFVDYYKYQFAPFHYEFFQDIKDLMEGKYREVAWIAFRESAKTSIAKIFLVWLICYNKRKYLNVDSFDKENAERILFDVVVELQMNPRILSDFGELYNAKRDTDQATQKRVSNFITNNQVRVEAHSTQESVRGRIHGHQRPDFLLIDDFETNKTKDSKAYTEQVISHINEFQAGLDSTAIVLYLGNYITEHGSVANLMDRAKTDHRLLIRNVPVIGEDGLPTWPDKYALTDEEAGLQSKVSLEDKRRMLGSQVFKAEMMNQPIDEETQEFFKKWFKYKKREDVMNATTRRFATIDTAFSKSEDSDNTGITKNYVTENNDWHFSAKKYRINPKTLIDIIFILHEEGFEKIGIEQGAYTDAIEPFFHEECAKRNKYPYLVPLKHGGIQKETRIRGLIPRYEAGKIWHIEGECGDLEDELLRFPRSLHDDVCFVAGTKIDVVNGEVTGHMPTGTRGVYEFMGSEVTSNHPYLTQRGFISLDSIQYSDRIVVWKNKLLMELSLEGIQNPRAVHIGTIFHVLQRSRQVSKLNASTGIYGKNTLVKFLRAFMFITKTTIHLITTYIISNVYLSKTTSNIMQTCQRTYLGAVDLLLRIIKRCRKPQRSGDIQGKVRNGTVNTQKNLSTKKKKLPVLSAEQLLSDTHIIQSSALACVRVSVNLGSGGRKTRDTILQALKKKGRKEVFATKTSNGWFFANGVLVSNCDSAQYQLKIAEPPYPKYEEPQEEPPLYKDIGI